MIWQPNFASVTLKVRAFLFETGKGTKDKVEEVEERKKYFVVILKQVKII